MNSELLKGNQYVMFKIEGQKKEVDKKMIHRLLLNIGIPSSLLGHLYILYALELITKNPEYLRNVTKMLYVDVAKKFNSTPSRIERAIRHAISVGWSYGSLDYINSIFGNSINPLKGTPTNSQFLSELYYMIESNSL